MKYIELLLFLRVLLYIYKCWHFYESNNTFIGQIKQSKIYNSILSIHNYSVFMKECSHVVVKQSYLLRLSEFMMTTENMQLYMSIYKITNCIHDPEILTNEFMEIIHLNDSSPIAKNKFGIELNAKGIDELYKITNDFDFFSKKLLSSNYISISEYNDIVHENNIRKIRKSITNTTLTKQTKLLNTIYILVETTYEFYKETINYLFYVPSHTPIYDKFVLMQKNMKSYYRYMDKSYRRANYLAIDIIDEVQLFTTKFNMLLKSSIKLYYSTGFLLTEIAGYVCGNDNALLLQLFFLMPLE